MRAELPCGWGMAKMVDFPKNGAIPSFGVECILDLQANGGKLALKTNCPNKVIPTLGDISG